MKTPVRFAAFFVLLVCSAPPAQADVRLASPFADHMVLQRDMPVPVWGWADPGEHVTVNIAGQKQSTTAAADGKWMLRLASLTAGGPLEMTVAGKNTITIKDVFAGEVWLASGQSNMAFPVSRKVASYAGLTNEEAEIAAANYPTIRMFTGIIPRAWAAIYSMQPDCLQPRSGSTAGIIR